MKPKYKNLLSAILLMSAMSPSWAANFGPSANDFGEKLWKNLDTTNAKDRIVCISPVSISAALTMVTVGANGITRQEMLNALFLEDQMELASKYGEFLQSMNQDVPKVSIANALVKTGTGQINPDYTAMLRSDFKAETFPGDLQEINAWVNQKTEGKIPTILNNLDPNSQMVILNAIYFKGNWVHPFDPTFTNPSPFTLPNKEVIQTETMNQQEEFSTIEGGNFQAIKLPYKGKAGLLEEVMGRPAGANVSMIILLPNEGTDPAALTANISQGFLTKIAKDLDLTPTTEVRLSLPKFKAENQFDLVPTLKALGIIRAFTNQAEFSFIGKNLEISQVIHKTFIEVEESGTEAAAATAVEMAVGTGMPAPIPAFLVNRPFFFLIYDHKAETTLFMGLVKDPRQTL
jgi:serpin B